MVGGIAGDNYGTIENCWVSADMASSHNSIYDADLGGIAGWNENGATIQFCCMTGNVTGRNSGVGGIAGFDPNNMGNAGFGGQQGPQGGNSNSNKSGNDTVEDADYEEVK